MIRDDPLTRLLAVALVLAVAGTIYVAVVPNQSGQAYTEFYLVNESGVAAGYPDSVEVGETGTVAVGVTNRRQSTNRYTVVVTFADRTVTEYGLALEAGETDERAVSFTPDRTGEFLLRALLYEDTDAAGEPSMTLRLHVTVTAASDTPRLARPRPALSSARDASNTNGVLSP